MTGISIHLERRIYRVPRQAEERMVCLACLKPVLDLNVWSVFLFAGSKCLFRSSHNICCDCFDQMNMDHPDLPGFIRSLGFAQSRTGHHSPETTVKYAGPELPDELRWMHRG